jgi:hypothetical protein
VLQQEKTLGKLAGIPDVEAYRQIAENMHKNGLLKLQSEQGNNPSTTPKVSSKSDTNSQANADRNKQRKAVAPVKQTTTKKSSTDEDFLGLSDADFMKKYANR